MRRHHPSTYAIINSSFLLLSIYQWLFGLTYYTSYIEKAEKMQIVMNLHRQLILFITDAVTDCVSAEGNVDFHISCFPYSALYISFKHHHKDFG